MSASEETIEKYIQAGQVKIGDIILIKGHPCKVIKKSTSKTGKHGHAKVLLTYQNEDSSIIEELTTTTHVVTIC